MLGVFRRVSSSLTHSGLEEPGEGFIMYGGIRHILHFKKNLKASKPLQHPRSVCVCVCVCVFSSHSFWTSSSLDVPAGVT